MIMQEILTGDQGAHSHLSQSPGISFMKNVGIRKRSLQEASVYKI
jgi:hypothetical protein